MKSIEQLIKAAEQFLYDVHIKKQRIEQLEMANDELQSKKKRSKRKIKAIEGLLIEEGQALI